MIYIKKRRGWKGVENVRSAANKSEGGGEVMGLDIEGERHRRERA
jgi:hypothetical protein